MTPCWSSATSSVSASTSSNAAVQRARRRATAAAPFTANPANLFGQAALERVAEPGDTGDLDVAALVGDLQRGGERNDARRRSGFRPGARVRGRRPRSSGTSVGRRRGRPARRRPSVRRTCAPRSRRASTPTSTAATSSHCGACTASVWTTARGARSRTSVAISSSGWRTPVSLLTSITETTAVRSSSAAASTSRSTTPSAAARRSAPPGSRRCRGDRTTPSTALCSIPVVDDAVERPVACACRPGRALDREVVALAAAAGEHDLVRAAAETRRRRLARRLRAPFSSPRDARVRARRVAGMLREEGRSSPRSPRAASASRPRGRGRRARTRLGGERGNRTSVPGVHDRQRVKLSHPGEILHT